MSASSRSPRELRQFPRLKAPACCRALGSWTTGPRRELVDLSEYGVCVHSDVARPPGERLEIEILLPDGSSVVLASMVAWSKRLHEGAVAAFDIGLCFIDPPAAARERLAEVLDHAPGGSSSVAGGDQRK